MRRVMGRYNTSRMKVMMMWLRCGIRKQPAGFRVWASGRGFIRACSILTACVVVVHI